MTGAPPREVPEYVATSLGTKQHRYALVIPVINEGERIRRQLQWIAVLAPPVDVIIADGGTTDGSLAVDFLASAGVRALLTKRGPGRLSAQLRMAYAWCLDEGYDGVVTMDGNGKDGAEAIATFVAKLDQGYDYIQGSRYRSGGRAINTPFDRKLAGRLIHAPLLSLAGRRCYTDTTNGFRAYSAGYLRDPRVNPFRDVFARYELLFYLTVRAGQLRFRTCEIPVTRAYPRSGSVPTKISGARGKLELLRELWDVTRGRYHPS
jgi:dolichol-phosphate mannosyltransferase